MTNLNLVDRSVHVDIDSFDEATLRLDCANALLTVIQCVFEGGVSMPSNDIICDALHGIKLLVESGKKQINNGEVE